MKARGQMGSQKHAGLWDPATPNLRAASELLRHRANEIPSFFHLSGK